VNDAQCRIDDHLDISDVHNNVASCSKCRDHLDEELGWAAAMRSPFRRHVEKLIEAERKKAAKR
jgi:hypothetical protein